VEQNGILPYDDIILSMKEGDLLNQRYQLLERLGSGGMAEVYRARDLMLERSVAIKVLRADYSSDKEFQERFRQEARAAANLSHPNIVTVHDFGLDNGQLFIVMEHIPGTDLKSLLRKRGRLSVDEAIPLMVQACAGIGYAHRAGLVHCDVKPHNLLITPDRRLKVTDFGIARALSTIHPGDRDDVVWGSPQYFSPEQARGQAPSPASDVYSLGVMLYEMLTGTLPFTATTAEELARMHIHSRPHPLSEYLPDIPPMLEQIEAKILSKEPSARYRTADQLGRVLLRFGTVRESTPPQLALTPEAVNNFEEPTSVGITEPVPVPVAASVAPELELDIDWGTIGLGLLALFAVGGLIPFWIAVYFAWNP
jgi:serine/threonine protein kinase